MAIDPNRTFKARIVPTCTAVALIAAGAALRLYRLDAMEFKGDEQEWLTLATQVVADRRWASLSTWPTHGMLSSNGVANAPLFVWIVAALWALLRDPVAVVRAIALVNVASLYPLWRWTRRRTDEFTALTTLAIAAVSPFAVIFSRKLWNPDLLLPGILALLWGVEWLRGGRPWRGVGCLLVALLLVGQLHQSGPIGMALLPVALGVQWWLDRRDGRSIRWGRPSLREAGLIVVALALNALFWLPYLFFFAHQPPGLLANRPTLAVVTPDFLVKIEAQVVPVDLLSFFAPHRADFLSAPVRAVPYYASVTLGVPLLVFGLWRWLRAPQTIPVFGIWWWLIVAAFTLARIPTHPFYVLALAPLAALLPAGGFDGPTRRAWLARALLLCRTAYVVALLTLAAATQAWLAHRGGAAGDYGVAYYHRKAQAQAIVQSADGANEATDELACAPPPAEVNWIVRWLDATRAQRSADVMVCDGWRPTAGELAYRWTLKR